MSKSQTPDSSYKVVISLTWSTELPRCLTSYILALFLFIFHIKKKSCRIFLLKKKKSFDFLFTQNKMQTHCSAIHNFFWSGPYLGPHLILNSTPFLSPWTTTCWPLFSLENWLIFFWPTASVPSCSFCFKISPSSNSLHTRYPSTIWLIPKMTFPLLTSGLA